MEMFGGQMGIAGVHLKGGMTQHSAEPIKIGPALNMPTCKSVPQVMPAEVGDSSTGTSSAE